MTRFNTKLPLLLLLFLGRMAAAQGDIVLTPEAFIQQVKQFHPVAKQASLITEAADAVLQAARGGFDPVLQMETNSKTLDGVRYYRYSNPEVKIPTPLGVAFKTGFENSAGQYRNPELTNGVASYVGVEVPLLSGMLIDKKRAALQQAKIYRQQSEQERQLVINDLLYDAYAAYWTWTACYELYNIYRKYVQLAENRSRLVMMAFNNGDRAAADTVEAFSQVQSYRMQEANALRELTGAALGLSLYLWSAGGEPYLLAGYYRPDTSAFTNTALPADILHLTGQLREQHPLLRTTRLKLQNLEVERKLKFQHLLPLVHLRANVLSKDYFEYKNLSGNYLENNYKYGVSIQVPLLLREGRGLYRGVRLKIKEGNLELDKKTWVFETKIRQYYNDALQLRQQLLFAGSMYQNYLSLLKIEELRFSQGESSLFMINSRENKTLEIEQKIIELRAKYLKAVYGVHWASATIK